MQTSAASPPGNTENSWMATKLLFNVSVIKIVSSREKKCLESNYANFPVSCAQNTSLHRKHQVTSIRAKFWLLPTFLRTTSFGFCIN